MDYDITYGDVLGEVVRRQIETVNKQKRVFCDYVERFNKRIKTSELVYNPNSKEYLKLEIPVSKFERLLMQLIDEENKCFPKEIEMSKTIDNKFLYLLLLSGSKELDFSELVNSDLYIGFKKWVDQNIDNDFLIIEILKIMSCIPLTITQLKKNIPIVLRTLKIIGEIVELSTKIYGAWKEVRNEYVRNQDENKLETVENS